MFKINMRLPLFLGKFQFHNAITQRLTLLISVLVHGKSYRWSWWFHLSSFTGRSNRPCQGNEGKSEHDCRCLAWNLLWNCSVREWFSFLVTVLCRIYISLLYREIVCLRTNSFKYRVFKKLAQDLKGCTHVILSFLVEGGDLA